MYVGLTGVIRILSITHVLSVLARLDHLHFRNVVCPCVIAEHCGNAPTQVKRLFK